MEKKKIVFFDADGTILDIEKGVPESAKKAISKLTANGHEAYLCTGRAYAFVPQQLRDMDFTGIVANCGAYIERKGKVLLDKEVSPEMAKKSVEIIRDCGMIPVLEGTDYMYYDKEEYTTQIDWFADLITKTLGDKWKPIQGNEENLHYAKISAKKTQGCDFERMLSELSGYYDFIIHEGGMASATTELVLQGITKGFAIALLCGTLGFDKTDTVCFGDSNNDIAMFDVCEQRVAMGNSSEELLKRATLVTTDMFHDGIYLGLEKLGLI